MAARIPVDYFFVPRPMGMTLDAYFLLPLQWDWTLLESRLALPVGSQTSTPDTDFETFRRRKDDGGLPFTICPVMICDAMAAYPDSVFVVLLEAPDDVRRMRGEERDRRWGTRVAMSHRWRHLDAIWRHAAPMVTPDVVLDGTVPLDVAACHLGQAIQSNLAMRGRGEKAS